MHQKKINLEDDRITRFRSDSKNIFEIEETIEATISGLQELDSRLIKVCEEIKEKMEFDFVTVQLVRPEEQIIEALGGVGASSKWIGQARHYLEPEPVLRDIQADIVQTCKTEVIAGWDSKGRLDNWLYDKYQHYEVSRVFTPIILIQNDDGINNDEWFKGLTSENLIVEDEYLDLTWFRKSHRHQPRDIGQHQSLSLSLPEAYRTGTFEAIVIGTIEVGFELPTQPIHLDQVLNLIRIVGEKSLYIRQAQLPCVLNKITQSAMNAVGASAASLHFLEGVLPERCIFSVSKSGRINSIESKELSSKNNKSTYIYNIFSGQIGHRFLRICPPRTNGLGIEALQENRAKTIPDYEKTNNRDLEAFNQEAFKSGIKAMAAFPLVVGDQRGVLYIHYKEEHIFQQEEISWLLLFSNRVKEAIRHAVTYIRLREQEKQLVTLHTVAHALSHLSSDEALLNQIASNALNVLAADAITIHKYLESSSQFDPPPAMAGRFKDSESAQKEVDEDEFPFKLINEYGKNIYASEESHEKLFANSDFVKRELIKATASILLRSGKQIVGTMFINFRRPHRFSKEEKQIIETLASSVAIAISNQRWSRTLNDIDQQIKIATNLNDLLKLIMKSAVEQTGAHLADVRMFEPITQTLVMKVWYPENTENVSLIRTRMGEGITGCVAESRKSILVNNTNHDPRYRSYFEKVGSELCVPLLDQDNYVIGVLNLESRDINAFEQRHLKMMEALADQAVIAIQNVHIKQRLIQANTMATLGDLTGTLIHRINNDFGKIRMWAQDILHESADEASKRKAEDIQALINRVLESTERLKKWISDEPEDLELYDIVTNTLSIIKVPFNVTCHFDIPRDLPRIHTGKQQLRYVFENLIQNAIDAMPSGGRLSIRAESIGAYLAIWIKDTGVGIPQEDQDHIYELEYSTKGDSRRWLGGYGLWWTKTYIERLGGQLTLLHSGINQGTEFSLLLPTV